MTATYVHCSISLWPLARQTSMEHVILAPHCRPQLYTIASLLIPIFFNFEPIRLFSTSQTDCPLHNFQCTLNNIIRRKPMKAMQTRRWEESKVFFSKFFIGQNVYQLTRKGAQLSHPHFHALENYATDMRYFPRALTPFSSPSVGASPLPPPINFIFVPQKQGKGRVGGHLFIFFFLSHKIPLF